MKKKDKESSVKLMELYPWLMDKQKQDYKNVEVYTELKDISKIYKSTADTLSLLNIFD